MEEKKFKKIESKCKPGEYTEVNSKDQTLVYLSCGCHQIIRNEVIKINFCKKHE